MTAFEDHLGELRELFGRLVCIDPSWARGGCRRDGGPEHAWCVVCRAQAILARAIEARPVDIERAIDAAALAVQRGEKLLRAESLLRRISDSRVAFSMDPGGPETGTNGYYVIEGWIREYFADKKEGTVAKPITPSEVAAYKEQSLPDVVLEVFNELIAENFSNGYANFTKDEAVDRMADRGLDRAAIYRSGWLDVEPIYEKAGWHVGYDKPGYNEDYPGTFTFKVRQ